MEVSKAIQTPIVKNWINSDLLSMDRLDQLKKQFENAEPFKHLYIDNLVVEDKFEAMVEELAEMEFEYKESDLFQLAQTPDVDLLDSDLLKEFKDTLRSPEFRSVMEYITGIPLSDDVDCLGNIYTDTDYLLCHDDKLIKRKIAYILYFTNLEEKDGGGLHLFDTDPEDVSKPGKIVKKIYPKYNRLSFFEVTRKSFHEVGEIMGQEVFRVSLSGWFNNEEN